jgi:HSP20 family protein
MLGKKERKDELAKVEDRPISRDTWLDPWNEFDRMFEDIMSDRWLMPFSGPRATMAPHVPRVDVTDEGDHLLIAADMPGVPKENVEVEILDGMLHVRSKVDEERKEEGRNYLRHERRYSSFSRSFMLPEGVKEDAIEANMRDGVLKVKVPKEKPEEPKKVTVKVD